jgi:hypothetical protein
LDSLQRSIIALCVITWVFNFLLENGFDDTTFLCTSVSATIYLAEWHSAEKSFSEIGDE